MNQTINFQLGDVVQLKSGGPKMTVVGISKDKVNCSWFADGKLEAALIPKAGVSKFSEKEKTEKKKDEKKKDEKNKDEKKKDEKKDAKY